MPAEIPLRNRIAAVKARPRYRAQMLRECFLDEARHGCDLQEVGREFWARYGIEPTRNLLAQQATLLLRDGRIVRVRQGWYRLAPLPMLPDGRKLTAASAPVAIDIFS